MRPYPHTADGKSVGADFSLPPAGSLLLFAPASGRSALARTSRAASGTETQPAGSTKLEPAGPLEVTRLKDNVLNLDFCDLTVDGRTERNLYTFEACNKLFNHCYGTGNPWDSAIQYRQTIVERDTLTTGDIRVSYHFVVAGDFDTRGMKLVAEQPGIWNVTFNGTPVEAAAPDTLLDSRFGIYPVGNLVRRGTNTVELSVSPMSIYAEIAPVYLFGDFVLESAGAGWIVREPAGKPALGSWKRQGLPFYSWDMAYGRDYDIDDPGGRLHAPAERLGGDARTGLRERPQSGHHRLAALCVRPHALPAQGTQPRRSACGGQPEKPLRPSLQRRQGYRRPVALEQRAQTAARQRLRPAGLRPAGRFRNRHDKITDHKP